MTEHPEISNLSLLYDRYAPALFGEVLRMAGNQADAETILQLIFIHIYRNRHEYDSEKSRLFTWLLRITIKISREYLAQTGQEHKTGRLNIVNSTENTL